MKTLILYISLFLLSGGSLLAQSRTDSLAKARVNAANLELNQNFPNPFSKSTTINFYSPSGQPTGFKVYNMIGTVVFTKEIDAEKGLNSYEFERGSLAPGFYFYSVQNGSITLTKRMMIRD
jgi:hypothetical protein